MDNRISVIAAVLMLLLTGCGGTVASRPQVVRMAELEIDPARLPAYEVAVREEMETSVRVEPGVLAIYAVADKDHPSKLRFFEMYADDAAYHAHIGSAHFRKYFDITKGMIMSRRLIEVTPVQLSEKRRGSQRTRVGFD